MPFIMNTSMQQSQESCRETGKFTPLSKETLYVNEFQNLLYEEDTAQQLALNNSFEEMEKSEHSEKNMKIMNQLNKRKEKEIQEKRIIQSMKERIKTLISEEKELISKNLQLKIDIKKLRKSQEGKESNQEIEQIKKKIGELKEVEKKLLDELRPHKTNQNSFSFGEKEEQGVQLSKDKTTHSTINLQSLKNPLTISVRSNPSEQEPPMPSTADLPKSPTYFLGASLSIGVPKKQMQSGQLLRSVQGLHPTNHEKMAVAEGVVKQNGMQNNGYHSYINPSAFPKKNHFPNKIKL